MGLTNFIPELWATIAEMELQKKLVYAQAGVINRDYEGQIQQQGDTVRINMIGPVTISNYVKGTSIGDPQELDSAQTALVVDQAKIYNFMIHDIDKTQANQELMTKFIRQAQYGMADVIDQYVAALMAAAVPSANTIGTDVSPKDDMDTVEKAAYNYLVDLGVKLDDAKVPSDGRWVIVPPWFYGYLVKDSRFTASGTATGDSVLRSGIIGTTANGFTVMKSHNVPNTASAKYKIIAGHDMATTFASQLVESEAFRPHNHFSDAFKGLHVYGAKVIRPEALAMLIANIT
jgi:hypothetical protein